jgi:hypothetical protein
MPLGAYLMTFGAMAFAALTAMTVFYMVDHLDSGQIPEQPAVEATRERIAG